jgi:hypothetical protein
VFAYDPLLCCAETLSLSLLVTRTIIVLYLPYHELLCYPACHRGHELIEQGESSFYWCFTTKIVKADTLAAPSPPPPPPHIFISSLSLTIFLSDCFLRTFVYFHLFCSHTPQISTSVLTRIINSTHTPTLTIIRGPHQAPFVILIFID